MIIAHVLSSFGVGGQEKMAVDLAGGQVTRGHQVLAISIASGADGPLGAEFAARGVEVHQVPRRGPMMDPTLPVRLAALLRRRRVEVVHTHNPQPLIYAGAAAKLSGARVVQTRHGVAFFSPRQVWLTRQAARLADAHVVVSRELEATLRAKGAVDGAALRIIENGIDLARFHPDAGDRAAVRAELGIPDDAFVIGCVSRLIASKCIDGLLRAAAPLLGDRVHLVVAGDGPERERLETLVRGHDKRAFVHLLGARGDVPRLLRAFDLFTLFSQTEGHPLVVLEAMASDVPVLATRVGGIPSIIEDGTTGFLVPVDDEAALASALAALAADPARRTAVGSRARLAVTERYSADRMVDDYLALYGKLTTERRWSPWSPSPSSVSRSSSTPTSATRS